MSQTQIKNNNKKLSKVKKPKPKGNTACILTLIFTIVISVGLFCLALAPFLYILFGLSIGFFAIIGVLLTTVVSAGLLWALEGYRNFWGTVFTWIGKVMDGQDVIVNTLKGSIVWISILLLLAASSGFIVNLVYFVKHKQNKAKFILSCIFFGLAIINAVLAIVIYLNWQTK